MKTTEFIKLNLMAVWDYYALPPINKQMHFKGECPMCGSKGSLRIDNKNGFGEWICKCGTGNIMHLLMEKTGLDFKNLANEIDEKFDNKPEYDKQPKEFTRNEPLENAMARWKSSSVVSGSNVQEYLRGRGIYSLPTKAVRYSSGNMFCIATDDKGLPFYSHETMLNGSKKANTKIGKKLNSLQPNAEYAQNIAIRCFDVSSTLGIAEGLETALSAHQIYKVNTWSMMNSGYMEKFRAPEGVDHLIIFADNDSNGTGLAAAFVCGKKNILSKNDVQRVTIRWCVDCGDFNDMLLNGSQVCEWVLNR